MKVVQNTIIEEMFRKSYEECTAMGCTQVVILYMDNDANFSLQAHASKVNMAFMSANLQNILAAAIDGRYQPNPTPPVRPA